jgi:hypothetical protein
MTVGDFFMRFIFIATIGLCLNLIQSKSHAADFSKLYDKYANAVVKITVKQQGLPVSFGSGFFVDPRGDILTNLHVVQAMMNPGFTGAIELKSGKKIEEFEVRNCQSGGLDLCLLRVKMSPPAWINSTQISLLKEGSSVAVIGHPRGLSWSVSDGIISGFRDRIAPDGTPFQMVQVSAPLSPGNSGGPAIDNEGRLVGIATSGIFDPAAENLNFAISGKSLSSFYLKSKGYSAKSLTQFKKDNSALIKAISKRLYNDNIKPEIDRILKNKPPLKEYKKIDLSGFDHSIQFLVPDIKNLIQCENYKKGYICRILNSYVSVAIRPAEPNMMKQNGHFSKSIPLNSTVELIKSGLLKDENSIIKDRMKYFFSMPSAIKCAKIKSAQQINYNRCEDFIYNYLSVDATLLSTQIQYAPNEPIIEITTIATDSSSSLVPFGLAEYIQFSMKKIKKNSTL